MSTEQHPNVALIGSAFAALKDGASPEDIGAMLFTENAVWHHLGNESPHAGRHEGRDAIVQNVIVAMLEDSSDTWQPTAVEITTLGNELVIVHVTESCDVGGHCHEGNAALVLKVVDGKVIEGVRLSDSALDTHWGRAAAAA